MKFYSLVIACALSVGLATAQNQNDALRYSAPGFNGGSRFNAMGGAFGALGADLSCGAYNPAGLALFRKGEISYSGAMRVNRSTGKAYGSSVSNIDAALAFNQFGVAVAWKPSNTVERRNVLAFTNTQVLNLKANYNYSGYTNSSSIAKDMLNVASQNSDTSRMNWYYEGLGYNAYLLDYENKNFFSFVDTKRSVLQSRTITNDGRVNDVNLSFAHAYKDKLYIGLSLGIPVVSFTSTTTHTERDVNDSMRVTLTSLNPFTYTTTYVDGLPAIYTGLLGFDNLTYTEFFSTKGTGVNLKFGLVMRPNDAFRFGFYYHSPTYFSLRDSYYNSLEVVFDGQRNKPISKTIPSGETEPFRYKIITPSRTGFSLAYIYRQLFSAGLDYEIVNYGAARLVSTNPSDFAQANSFILRAYQPGHNFRLGAELNVKPLMLRLGYYMQGSAYGALFKGNQVRHGISYGIGFRTSKNFCYDFSMVNVLFSENYYPFRNLATMVKFTSSNTMFSVTVGYKF